MGLPLVDLIPLLRTMLDDTGDEFQQYTDEELVRCLRIGIMSLNASWPQDYKLQLNETDPENPIWEITNDPPESMQILYLWKTLIGMRTWSNERSYDNGVLRVTAKSKKEDLEALKAMFEEIMNEQKYSNIDVGYSSNTLNDYFNNLTYYFGYNWWTNGIRC